MTHSGSLVLASLCVLVGLIPPSVGQRHLCGRVLADTLDLVCAGRGFHLGKRNGRSVGMVYGKYQNQKQKQNQNQNSPIAASGNDGSVQGPANAPSVPERPSQALDHKTQATNDLNAFQAHRAKRGRDTPSRILNALRSSEGGIEAAAQGRHRRNARGQTIVDECCLQACTFSALESYCAAPDDPQELLSLNQLRVRLGFTPRPTARPQRLTASNQNSSFIHPSAQINRGQSRGQDNSYFYLSLGQQATRSPLLQKRRP